MGVDKYLFELNDSGNQGHFDEFLCLIMNSCCRGPPKYKSIMIPRERKIEIKTTLCINVGS